MARPTKLTPEIQARIVQAITGGNYAEIAAGYAGIGERTYYRWMAMGERAKSGIYRQFWQAVKEAEKSAEVWRVATIIKASDENWTAAAWWLERKFPERWGRKDALKVTTWQDEVIALLKTGRITIEDVRAELGDEYATRLALAAGITLFSGRAIEAASESVTTDAAA